MSNQKKVGAQQGLAAVMIEVRPIEALTPYARNSRTHSDDQVGQIVGSLEEFGMVGAIVVRDGVIAKGHGTLAAISRIYGAKRLLYPAPGKSAGAQPYPEGMVPVIDCSGWTDAQFRAYVIADNKLALNAGWNYEMLAVELDELRDLEFNVDLVGFSSAELNDLIGTDVVPPPPDSFNEYDEDIETEHCCPKCGYKWSGKSNAGGE